MYVCTHLEHESHGLVESLSVDVAPGGGVQLDAHVNVYQVVTILSGAQPRITIRSLPPYIHTYIYTNMRKLRMLLEDM